MQDTTGIAGDANKSRDAKTNGNISRRGMFYNSRDASNNRDSYNSLDPRKANVSNNIDHSSVSSYSRGGRVIMGR